MRSRPAAHIVRAAEGTCVQGRLHTCYNVAGGSSEQREVRMAATIKRR